MAVARCLSATVLFCLPLSAVDAKAQRQEQEPTFFEYDLADETVSATVFDNPDYYDADVASIGGQLWLTWLEFTPKQGDHIWVGRYDDGKLVHKRRASSELGEYANPTLTVHTGEQVFLSYEGRMDGQWDVLVSHVDLENAVFPPAGTVSDSPGPDIHHCQAAHPDRGTSIIWQSGSNGQFDIRGYPTLDGPIHTVTVSQSPTRGDWHPDVAVAPDGAVCVVWDGYDGDSFNVYARTLRKGKWGEVIAVTGTPAFEGRAQVVSDPRGGFWVLWEEGAENWGKEYRMRMRLKSQDYWEISDASGPLHRFRRLHLARLDKDGRVQQIKTPLPMPSIERALNRPDAPLGNKNLGAFYERGRLVVDDKGRLWVLYRHYYFPSLGIVRNSHKEEGWQVYARCLDASGWSKLYRFDVGQGDGMQSLAVTSHGDGIAAVWTTGRTDRRDNDRPRGIAVATLTSTGDGPANIELAPAAPSKPAGAPSEPAETKNTAAVGGKEYELFFGDLHRHTDLSLCFVTGDGTIDDCYRYAIDVDRLDFLGITDHSRDIAKGDALSQLWWRCRKEVTRHELKPSFLPYFSYERSRGGEDHNVISLRPDMLRSHLYPHPAFWKELDDDTITIPHQTSTKPIKDPARPPRSITAETWKTHDNKRRPLLEIYQGCRDRSIERDAHEGLAKRYLFGLIASSDHSSTSGSYAGVWAEDRTRESIFRAMQARRTFGATAKIELVVRAGDHWMGEHFTAETLPRIHIEAIGTTAIKAIDIIIDGEVADTISRNSERVNFDYTPKTTTADFHYLYVRLHQADGNRAWSSPIWVESVPPASR